MAATRLKGGCYHMSVAVPSFNDRHHDRSVPEPCGPRRASPAVLLSCQHGLAARCPASARRAGVRWHQPVLVSPT